MTVEYVETFEAAIAYRGLDIYSVPIPHGAGPRTPRGAPASSRG